REPDVVEGLDFEIDRGEKMALVGESGAGKSLTALSIIGLLPHGCTVRRGTIAFDGVTLNELPERVRNRYRGGRIGMIFQEPMSALHPGLRVGDQVAECIEVHNPWLTRRQVRQRVLSLLTAVGIPDPERRAQEHPHTWSGGMRQRAITAIAIANEPDLLIADEPTTALDVTVQAQILALLTQICDTLGTSLLLISHDLGVVSQIADRVAVMYAARLVEEAALDDVFDRPRHPYTRGLLLSRPETAIPGSRLQHIPGRPPTPRSFPSGCRFHPRCGLADDRCRDDTPELDTITDGGRVACFHWESVALPAPTRDRGTKRGTGHTVLEVRDLQVHFGRRRRQTPIRAVDGVSFEIGEAETLALVGESGCGKTTTARAVVRLVDPTAGSVRYRGSDIMHLSEQELGRFRREVQIVFQDPHASLNPRRTVRQIIEAPLQIHGISREGAVDRVLELVGLALDHADVLPHELSGGQRQRVAIARALVLDPSVIILDEPLTALDVSIQAQILNLLQDLRDRLGLAYLLIAHDLGVVRTLADRVAVMYLGRIVESGPVSAVLSAPTHPYTRALLDSIPNRSSPPLHAFGEVPDPGTPPSGCRFNPRCRCAEPRCAEVEPVLVERDGSWSACHYPLTPAR
ncbi:MAG: dipeptide ABC transporter ATP-binding protein, partial [Acidimicrobiia bacterium]